MQTIGADIGKIGDSVIPIVSNITSGAKLLVAWGKVGLAKYREYDTAKHGAYVAKGDMEAAFKSLELLLERKVTSETLQAGIQTADFTARTAMSFVDFGAVSGTMIGVISSLSKLVHKLYLLGREYSETRSARVLLGNPAELDYTLFEAYPMLGCYMLLCSDLSEIIALSRTEAITAGVPFGGQGWMDDVEYLKRHHIDPILERASEFVYKSPFLVPNMPLHALYKPNVVDKAGTKYSQFQFLMNAAKVGHKVVSAAV